MPHGPQSLQPLQGEPGLRRRAYLHRLKRVRVRFLGQRIGREGGGARELAGIVCGGWRRQRRAVRVLAVRALRARRPWLRTVLDVQPLPSRGLSVHFRRYGARELQRRVPGWAFRPAWGGLSRALPLRELHGKKTIARRRLLPSARGCRRSIPTPCRWPLFPFPPLWRRAVVNCARVRPPRLLAQASVVFPVARTEPVPPLLRHAGLRRRRSRWRRINDTT